MIGETKQVALLVHTCDRYEFLYRGFEYFFLRHWDLNIPCKYYFATEEKTANVKGFENILSGPGEWSDRLAVLLKKIPEDYVIYFQEDMWLCKDVNPVFFQQLFEMAIGKNWKQVKLNSSNVYITIPTPIFIEGFNIALIDNKKSQFLMSHQVTLWNKQHLLNQLVKGEHPWRNERKGSRRLKKLNPEIYHADCFMENGRPENNTNNGPIKRSQYWTVSANAMFNERILHYLPALESGNEAIRKYAAEVRFHYENGLTHDGKQSPRKEDLYMKIKKRVKNFFSK